MEMVVLRSIGGAPGETDDGGAAHHDWTCREWGRTGLGLAGWLAARCEAASLLLWYFAMESARDDYFIHPWTRMRRAKGEGAARSQCAMLGEKENRVRDYGNRCTMLRTGKGRRQRRNCM
jgi:hypothetical protein